MNIAWFTPFSNKSAIGKVSRQICEELAKSCNVDIWTHHKEDLIETDVKVIIFEQNTKVDELQQYDYVIYNIGNFAGNHRDIYDMSQKKPGIVILHDQTMYSYWGQYYLMPEFGGDSIQGFQPYRNMYRQYYGETAEMLAVEAYQSGHYPIYDYKNISDYKLIEPVVKNAIGVFTHAKFFIDRIKDFFNGPIGYTYLPCEAEKSISKNEGVVYDIIKKARSEKKLIMLSNGIVHPVKHIDKVTNVLHKNKKLSKEICYIVIGSYGGAYGEDLEQLSNKNLKGCLHMLGYQDDSEMIYALQNVDLCINLRYPNSEVCSLSLLEQMTYGKPTIVINSGIYGEMPDDCVLKISVDNEEKELEEVLLQVLENKVRFEEIGRNAKEFIKKNCNIKTYCKDILEFLDGVNVNKQISNLQNRMIDDIGIKLINNGFNDDTVPSTIRNMINLIGDLFGDIKADSKRDKVIGVWAGFLYHIPNLKREGITRFMVYMISSMLKNYPINVEVWSYSFNEEELKDSFSSILGDSLYNYRIKFITEKNWDNYFTPNPEFLSYGKEINEQLDNLCDIARDYSKADCFIPMIIYLDNVIGTEKPIFVPAHDMAVAEHYYDFIIKDPLYKFRYLDINSRADNLARNGAIIFSNCDTVRQTQILKYIKSIREERTAIIYLPVNIPEGIENNILEEQVIRDKFNITGRYLFYPTQIRPYKNVVTLIKALQLIKDEYHDLNLVLTGNPRDVPEVEELINTYELDDRINLISSVAENELYSIYKYAAAVPVPSVFEGGFPWQACEALYMNVPLVLSITPIVEERIHYHKMTIENCGIQLFDPIDEKKLAQGLREVLNDKEAAVTKQNRFRNALLSYNWDNAAKEYYNLFFHETNNGEA